MPFKFLETSPKVSLADPLWMNQNLSWIIHAANNEKASDFRSYVTWIVSNTLEFTENTSNIEIRAIHRDLWYLLAMDRKLWSVLWDLEDEIVRKLMLCSFINDMPPRDHLLSYTLENPTGDFERLYTWSEEEVIFIDALRQSYIALCHAVEKLQIILSDNEIDDFVSLLEEAKKYLQVLPMTMKNVNAALPREKFAEILKSSFHSIEIADTMYASPCGWALPIIVFDNLLYWDQLTDDENEEYKKFISHFSPYLPNELRSIQSNTSVFEAIINRNIPKEKELLGEIFRLLISFRWPHFGAAKRNIPAIKKLWVWAGSFWESPLMAIIQINKRLLSCLS